MQDFVWKLHFGGLPFPIKVSLRKQRFGALFEARVGGPCPGVCGETSGLDEGGVQAACPRSLRFAAGQASRQFLHIGPEESVQRAVEEEGGCGQRLTSECWT
jgi:hypothetical protein